MKTIIAVDPGSGGGIVVRNDEGVFTYAMPESLFEIRCRFAAHCGPHVTLAIEEVPKFCGKNIPQSSIAVLFQNFGRIEGIAATLGFRLVRVHPKAWQKHHALDKAKKKSSPWKRELRSRAQELFPEIEVTLKTADALLILDWAIATNA